MRNRFSKESLEAYAFLAKGNIHDDYLVLVGSLAVEVLYLRQRLDNLERATGDYNRESDHTRGPQDLGDDNA